MLKQCFAVIGYLGCRRWNR